MTGFKLHPDLVRDGLIMGDFDLCRVLLINDSHYPWFVLVPKRVNISDIIDLTPKDQKMLWEESRIFSQCLKQAFNSDKLNIAALGNMTPQLHIHHIVRFKSDPAWPAPIWGKHPLKAYSAEGILSVRNALKTAHLTGFIPS